MLTFDEYVASVDTFHRDAQRYRQLRAESQELYQDLTRASREYARAIKKTVDAAKSAYYQHTSTCRYQTLSDGCVMCDRLYAAYDDARRSALAFRAECRNLGLLDWQR